MAREGQNGRQLSLAHRSFEDSLGRKWEVWTVVPSHAERRRRLAEGTHSADGVDSADGAPDRRRQEEFRVLLGREWSEGWLAFETAGEKRRLAPIPDGWDSMSAEELEALMRRATRVRPSRRLVE